MKTNEFLVKNVRAVIPMIVLSLFMLLAGCNDDDDNGGDEMPDPDNIVEVAIANGYDVLAAALVEAGLDDDLSGDGPFTVFAPTDAAFNAAGITVDNVDEVENLEEILLYHVVSGSVSSTQLSSGEVETLNGQSITVDASALTIDGIDIIEPYDVEASNGLIHTIDGVLMPDMEEEVPTLVEAATSAGLNTLLEAVEAADLGATLLDADAITVFAPTDDAFMAALAAYDVDNLDQLVAEIGGVENLETVLNFHVVPAVAFAEDLDEGEQTFTTVAGQDITVTKTGSEVTVTDALDSTYMVVTADVAIENGVVHVINGVLMPTIDLPTVVEAATAAELNTLLDAVTAAELGTALTEAEAITVFAPIDEAFVGLLERYDAADLEDLIQKIGAPAVTEVLQFHVVPAVAFSHDLADGEQTFPTLQGQEITVTKTEEGVMVTDYLNRTFMVTMPDVAIENGVVHVIDGVVIPDLSDDPNIIEAGTEEDLTTLLQAVTAAELRDPLLQATAITVFAPDNEAFADLLDAQEVEDLQGLIDKLGADAVAEVLQYHVVPMVAFSDDLMEGDQMVETLAGEQLTVNKTGSAVTVTDVNGTTYNVTMADVTIENGVVHVIDGVLLPTL